MTSSSSASASALAALALATAAARFLMSTGKAAVESAFALWPLRGVGASAASQSSSSSLALLAAAFFLSAAGSFTLARAVGSSSASQSLPSLSSAAGLAGLAGAGAGAAMPAAGAMPMASAFSCASNISTLRLSQGCLSSPCASMRLFGSFWKQLSRKSSSAGEMPSGSGGCSSCTMRNSAGICCRSK